MAVYVKFKSEKFFCNFTIQGDFISVSDLRHKIFKARYPGREGKGRDFDLVICNADTNEEYVGRKTLIPKCTAVTVRRIPGWSCRPIVVADSSKGDKIPAPPAAESSSFAQPKIEVAEGFQKLGKRKAPERSVEFVCKVPRAGYICRRCGVAGHYIQHCPTNGDPEFEIKRWKRPTVKADEAAFEKEAAGIAEASTVAAAVPDSAFPPEFLCRLCGHVMRDAVMTGKCCFCSFCDGCIRGLVSSKHACVCGEKNVLADDLVPNRTLRDAISSLERKWRREALAAEGNLKKKRCYAPHW